MQTQTVAALRALARERGLSGYSKLRKDDLVALLRTSS
ncbi:MAG: Rho termination factor N-terminal domain-containing protein [Beutenbergiaceae bacterium]